MGFLLDVILRFFIVRSNKKNAHTCKIIRLPSNVIKIEFPKKNFDYKAGQYVFIAIPALSYFEWHPFSISSSPH
jgi:predicted ferric reductase